MDVRIEVVVDGHDRCGEAPIWDAVERRLIWADATAGAMFEHRPASRETKILARDLAVSGIALNDDGRLVIAGSTGLRLWKRPGEEELILATHAGETLNFNDIIADARGRVYAGTYYRSARDLERYGKLYVIDTDGAVRVVDDGIELSNGLGFSPDDRILYYADTMARKIYAYDIDPSNGALRNKRVFVTVPRDEGLPDGLTVDAEGFIWNAQWYGRQVVRYDPTGRVERRLALPVQQVSSVMFGGDDSNDLYITSAGEAGRGDHAPPAFDPHGPMGGALYRVRLDVRGRPEHRARLRGASGSGGQNSDPLSPVLRGRGSG